MSDPQTCVIFTPTAARGRARRRLEAVRAMLAPAGYQTRRHAGHAEALAVQAARDGFDTVAAAGGDGTVHEVANGLLRANHAGVLFGVVPLGSANDYAYSLDLQARNSPPPEAAA